MSIPRANLTEVACEAQSPVVNQLNGVHAALDELDLRLDRLVARIAPVLSSETPEPPTKDALSKAFSCPLEEQISDIRKRIDQEKDRITKLAQRVQL